MNDTKSIPQLALDLIKMALAEEIGDGDVTGNATIPAEQIISGRMIAKQEGIVAGIGIASLVFKMVDPQIDFIPEISDGDSVSKGSVIARFTGPGRSLLQAERLALNFLQRMSGIATLTHQFMQAMAGTKAIILDTRKTAPGLRYFDKLAVRSGGGQNHRIGLYDMVLIKENHIAAAGGITSAVKRVREHDTQSRPIEVEITNLEEFREALALKPDRIMLDNMSLADMRTAVEMRNAAQGSPVMLEASGNVTLETVAEIAKTGVDFISSGSLTHSVMALDISMLVDEVASSK
ncbi:MAG: carboxylating nicotinate-nucleotide diphosphorylase [Chloroflexota bacterium]